jgi:nitroreductase
MNNPTLETLNNLRSIHWDFNGKMVSDSDMRKIIEQGMRAAHSTNLADYSVIVVDEADIMKKLVGNSGPARCCIFCIDKTRTIAAAKMLGRNDYAPDASWYALFAELYDVYSMAQTSVIAAKSMGIDSLITNGVFRVDINGIKQLLNLPEKNCFPVIAVLFGYSDKPEENITGRISVDHVLHFNSYNSADENDIRKFIDEMDKIYPEYISEKYPQTMSWYFDKWLFSGTGKLEAKDTRLHDALIESGYYF